MRGVQAGFSLLEVLVSAALFALVALGAFELLRQTTHGAQQAASRGGGYAALDRLAERLRGEARSATSIAVAATAGAAHDDCDEIAFASATSAGPRFWSYRRFPNHGAADAVANDVVLRVGGSAPAQPCDPVAAAETAAAGVRVWRVRRVLASTLRAHADPYLGGAASDTPFAGGSVGDTAVPLGFAGANGGNGVVEVVLAGDDASRALDLVPDVFPSGFSDVLAYTCDARCTVGHGADGLPKSISTCALDGWVAAWPDVVAGWAAGPADASGAQPLVAASYWLGGWFVFTYSGVAPGGSTDVVTHRVFTTNAYDATPGIDPAQSLRDGTPAPFSAPPAITGDAAAAAAWYARFADYVADAGAYNIGVTPGPRGEQTLAGHAGLATEGARCAAVAAGSGSYD